MTKILIAEDDALLRELLDVALRRDFPELTLVGTGLEALEHLRRHPVDVLLTDWLMPELDGIELIRRVRAECSPAPFIIMSTVLGSKEAREHALRSGADDFLAKPSRPAEIRRCIELASQRCSSSRLIRARPVAALPAASLPGPLPPHVVVGIATSTGGPEALNTLFADTSLPDDCVYLVALHGPEWLHRLVVEAVQRRTGLRVALAEDGLVAQPGSVYFACNDRHLLVDAELRLKFDDSPPEHYLRPAADPMFRSLARASREYTLAVVLTGMGCDGAAGAADIAAAGGKVLVQDPKTSIVGGMPSAALEAGIGAEVLPLSSVGCAVTRHVRQLNQALTASRGAIARPARA